MIKPGARLEGAWVEEVRNSQRLFFISKELQLNTKFHYIEVIAALENYEITICISKITVKRECEREEQEKEKEKEKGKEERKKKQKKQY